MNNAQAADEVSHDAPSSGDGSPEPSIFAQTTQTGQVRLGSIGRVTQQLYQPAVPDTM
jgi:hypothetical protein